MRKSIFIVLGICVYSCELHGEVNHGKKNPDPKTSHNNHNDDDNGDDSHKRDKTIKKENEPARKRRYKKGDLFITTHKDNKKTEDYQFFILSPKGQYLIKVKKADGKNTSFALSNCTITKKNGIFTIQHTRKDFPSGTLNEKGIKLLLETSLPGLIVNSTQNPESDTTTYTFSNYYTNENRESINRAQNNWTAKCKKDKSKISEEKEYENTIELLGQTFFTSITGMTTGTSFKECLEYMNEQVSLNEDLASMLSLQQTVITRAALFKKVCDHLKINTSFASSICSNSKKDGLKKFFENFIKLDFLDKLKKLLNQKGSMQQSLFSISNLSSICHSKGFEDFEKLMKWLENKHNLQIIEDLKNNGIAFENLSSICNGKGFEAFEKFMKWLENKHNLQIIEDLKNNGITFENLSSICHSKGFEDFEKLIIFLDSKKTSILELKTNHPGFIFKQLYESYHKKGSQKFKDFFEDVLKESLKVENKESMMKMEEEY